MFFLFKEMTNPMKINKQRGIWHAAAINDSSGYVAFKPLINHELILFLSTHEQIIRLAAWDGGERDGEQRKWTQMVIAILKQHFPNLTAWQQFVLPHIVIISIFNVFVLVYEKELFQ